MPYALLMMLVFVVGAVAYSAGAIRDFVNKVDTQAATIQRLERDKSLRIAREAAHRLQLQRRDEAIAASKCAKTITGWVKNPDTLPRKFTPFDQLNPPVR